MEPVVIRAFPVLRGVLFDLDNTLVDSGLDFDAMRRAMGLPDGVSILEAIERLPPDRAARCRQILHEFELAGAARAAGDTRPFMRRRSSLQPRGKRLGVNGAGARPSFRTAGR